jgi:hypothetical protein
MWMVFDNMTKEEIQCIRQVAEGSFVVTGNTSAKGGYNRIAMKFKRCEAFRANSYLREGGL